MGLGTDALWPSKLITDSVISFIGIPRLTSLHDITKATTVLSSSCIAGTVTGIGYLCRVMNLSWAKLFVAKGLLIKV
jgi:hypothetical protein